jgi:hypothetical protein
MLQEQKRYVPETPAFNSAMNESHLRQLSSALKDHFAWWVSYQNEGIHEDKHGKFKFLQVAFNIPKWYENPDRWYHNQQYDAKHCLKYHCVSVWWYYDQAMRDIPGF